MGLIEQKYFVSPDSLLNSDDDQLAVSPNSWVNMVNCRTLTTDAGVTGTVESIGSTQLLDTPQPSINYVEIGSAPDEQNSRFIYFLKNTTGTEDKIICYYPATQQLYTVVLSSQITGGLNFNKNILIHSTRVENGYVYWCEGTNNEPRRININYGINLNHPNTFPSDYTYTDPISPFCLYWIRRQPGLPLTSAKNTNVGYENNFIKNEAFQFLWRYIYRGYEISTLSALSLVENYNLKTDTYNYITITAPLGESIQQDVLQVDFVAKFLNGNVSFVIKSWNKNISADATAIANHNSGTPLSFDFYNDLTGIALDPTYQDKPYDSVPIYAWTIEMARNRAFMGNYISGYNTPTTTSLAVSTSTNASPTLIFKTGSIYQVGVSFLDHSGRKTGILTNNNLKVTIPNRAFTQSSWIDFINWTLSNNNALNEIPLAAYYYSINVSKCLYTRFFEQLNGINSTYLKKDSNGLYVFGTQDYDNSLAGCAFDISSLNNFSMGYSFSEGDLVNIYISGVSTVYTLSIIGQQGNYIITELQNLGTLNATTLFMFQIYTPYKPATNEPLFEVAQIYKVLSPGTSGRLYSQLSGSIRGDTQLLDRAAINRVLYTINTVDEKRNDDQDATLGVLYQSQDSSSADFSTGSSPFRSLAGFNIATNNDRWIIKNNTVSNLTFRLSGFIKVYPDSNRVWRMFAEDNASNITTLVPDTNMNAFQEVTFTFDENITLAAGNRLFIFHHQSVANSMYFRDLSVVISLQSSSSAITYPAEAMSPNDKFYKNWFTDAGRPNFVTLLGQTTKTNSIAWSNTYIQGTETNGLSTFDALDTTNLDAQAGSITKLQLTSKIQNELGIVMLAICVKQTASMYLGETQQYGSNQQTTLTLSTNVIGTINFLKGNYGTTHAESVVEYRGRVYWWDDINGRIIQYADNGLFPISNYKMTRFWKLFSDTFKTLTTAQIEALGGRPFVFATVDPRHDELIFSIPKLLSVPPKGYLPDYPSTIYPFDIWDGQGKSIVYKLDLGASVNPHWQGAYSFNPEGFCTLANNLYSFYGGHLYLHNLTTSFNNFYGVQYTSKIMCVANQLPQIPKSYNNIGVKANMQPYFVYFYADYPFQQSSDLVDYDPNWKNYEGIFYATLYRNKLIPTASGYDTTGLLTGQKLRTQALFVMLEFSVTNIPVELKFLQIGYDTSRGHPLPK